MKNTISELDTIVDSFTKKIMGMPDSEFSAKPMPHKWSKKEVLGHLIDSAQNNLRRFICGQYESNPPNIVYDQDFWVKANNYQAMEKKDVMELWKLVNGQISVVLAAMPVSNFRKQVDTGKGSPELHELQWLAQDYVKHLKHHLNQIVAGSFDIVYP